MKEAQARVGVLEEGARAAEAEIARHKAEAEAEAEQAKRDAEEVRWTSWTGIAMGAESNASLAHRLRPSCWRPTRTSDDARRPRGAWLCWRRCVRVIEWAPEWCIEELLP